MELASAAGAPLPMSAAVRLSSMQSSMLWVFYDNVGFPFLVDLKDIFLSIRVAEMIILLRREPGHTLVVSFPPPTKCVLAFLLRDPVRCTKISRQV